MITTQDYICMNKYDKVTLSYGVTPEICKDSVAIESNDTSIVAVKGNVITAINEGEARLTLTFASATSEIVVYVGYGLRKIVKFEEVNFNKILESGQLFYDNGARVYSPVGGWYISDKIN